MIPNDAIQDWLDQQDHRVREHISSTLLTYLGFQPEVIAAGRRTTSARLEQWLNGAGAVQCGIGRVVVFRALGDFCFGDRFAGDGWAFIESLYRSIDRDPRVKPSTRGKAKAFLSDLPALQREWVRAGIAWEELTKSALSDVSRGLAVTIEQLQGTSTAPPPLSTRTFASAGEQG